MSPREKATLWLGIATAALIAVIFSFFAIGYYSTIQDKTDFWIGYACWTLPFVIAIWAVRNTKSPKRVQSILSDVMIGVGFAIIAILALGARWTPLVAVGDAAMPGILTGILIGADSLLIIRILENHLGPEY